MASVWKFWPETKGLPLESIGALFGDQIAGSNQDYPKLREGTPEDGLKSAGSDHLEA